MQAPSWIDAQFLVSVGVIVLVVHALLAGAGLFIYFERKISAYIQDRLGPNRVGFDLGLPYLKPLRGMWGLGQTLADGLKMFLKEDFTPTRADKIMFFLAPGLMAVPALIAFLIIPWGGQWHINDFSVLGVHFKGGLASVSGASISVGVVWTLAVAAVGVYGVTLGGWAANNKFSFLGGLRASAQMISYEIPMGLTLLTALLAIGTVMPQGIVKYQAEHGWLLFSQPLAAIIFFIAAMAEANRAPFDIAECEQELVGGYHTEYSSMRYGLYPLSEYMNMANSSAFFSLVFLGGYQALPFVHDPFTGPDATGLLAVLLKCGVYAGKVIGLVIFMMVIRWTIPRFRYDQVMIMAWQFVIPLALVNVVVVSTMVYFNLTGLLPMLAANAGVVVLLMALQRFIPEITSNRRVPLYGSRFSPMPGELVRTQSPDRNAHADNPAVV